MHIYAAYLMIIIGGIIIDSLIRISAGGIEGYLVLAVAESAAPALLINAAENVEKLSYALLLRIARDGIHPNESRADESRLRGQISRQPHCAHSAAVLCQSEVRSERIVSVRRR